MPTDTLISIADSLRTAADALTAAGERMAAMERLLLRCREMCREDGMTLGPLARALVAEIEAALGN